MNSKVDMILLDSHAVDSMQNTATRKRFHMASDGVTGDLNNIGKVT